MSAHTPGPWRTEYDLSGDLRIAGPDMGRAGSAYIATPHYWQSASENEQTRRLRMEADARLIAAAPDLLAALNKAREDLDWMLNNRQFLNPEVFDYIDAALAKVEGE
jgi:hypothetical protein